MTEVFPKRLPPLRGDRETVVIGTFKGKGPFAVQVAAESAGGPQKLDFRRVAEAVGRQQQLSDAIGRDGPNGRRRHAAAGRRGEPCRGPAERSARACEALGELAQQALAAGNLDNAEQLVAEALRRDPNDAEALAIKGALAKRQAGGKTAAAGAGWRQPLRRLVNRRPGGRPAGGRRASAI